MRFHIWILVLECLAAIVTHLLLQQNTRCAVRTRPTGVTIQNLLTCLNLDVITSTVPVNSKLKKHPGRSEPRKNSALALSPPLTHVPSAHRWRRRAPFTPVFPHSRLRGEATLRDAQPGQVLGPLDFTHQRLAAERAPGLTRRCRRQESIPLGPTRPGSSSCPPARPCHPPCS